ncbi:MAG: hypothetical protein A3C06_01925 [Candidatus Taylorbacteria bacterium RIFCSPHIGHO2_02_FULL_46_13]|uniref:DUF86 domain-containing protein n=1 Tax=Candidatus Taylorbacteria bacterium RIFCSPHIGHO2_02_FULL_46_13 TaxID=1802312 RepID=A0A1G2MSI7_9BACT|nr:MAG: hypothetical protein A3C06_01925 [Candidatus Taylorbacteria bacterium RIFCSPHIGHO2_02_FULL_46_13]
MPEVFSKKISLLKGYASNLADFLAKCRGDKKPDDAVFLSIERLFQLMVDEAVDINAMILEQEHKPFPDTNQGTFETLADIGIISKGLRAKIAGSVGLRNRLVHRYETVQKKVLVEEAVKYLAAYKEYLVVIVKKFL